MLLKWGALKQRLTQHSGDKIINAQAQREMLGLRGTRKPVVFTYSVLEVGAHQNIRGASTPGHQREKRQLEDRSL